MTSFRPVTLMLMACLMGLWADCRPETSAVTPRRAPRGGQRTGHWSAKPVGHAPNRHPRRPGKLAVLPQEDDQENPERSHAHDRTAWTAVPPVPLPAFDCHGAELLPRHVSILAPLYLTLLTLLL